MSRGGGRMQELEQVPGAETRNVPSTFHVGAAGWEMGTEVLRRGTGIWNDRSHPCQLQGSQEKFQPFTRTWNHRTRGGGFKLGDGGFGLHLREEVFL